MHYAVSLFLAGLLLSSLLLVKGQEISDQCLGCICHGCTGCNKSQGCSASGACGPFLITKPFWEDGGKLIIKGANPANAFNDCSNDLHCAAETIRRYGRRYAKDCDRNGVIDCEDSAIMHQTGPDCGDDEIKTIHKTSYYKKFAACKSLINPN